jgi:hypothetical protein
VTLCFAAINREEDWQPIMPALNRVLARYRNRVRVKVVYDQQFFDALQTAQKEFEPLCSYERYQAILHTCDISLLPLLPNSFNSMKSDLKFLECAGHGAVVLASPTVYACTVKDNETGLIYHSVEEFETKLQALIEDAALRLRLAETAYQWVRDNRLLGQHYRRRYDWYLSLLGDRRRLDEELRSRVPELFTDK